MYLTRKLNENTLSLYQITTLFGGKHQANYYFYFTIVANLAYHKVVSRSIPYPHKNNTSPIHEKPYASSLTDLHMDSTIVNKNQYKQFYY